MIFRVMPASDRPGARDGQHIAPWSASLLARYPLKKPAWTADAPAFSRARYSMVRELLVCSQHRAVTTFIRPLHRMVFSPSRNRLQPKIGCSRIRSNKYSM
ncbi:protein of unknown function [Paraburkholderia kururiensis]